MNSTDYHLTREICFYVRVYLLYERQYEFFLIMLEFIYHTTEVRWFLFVCFSEQVCFFERAAGQLRQLPVSDVGFRRRAIQSDPEFRPWKFLEN